MAENTAKRDVEIATHPEKRTLLEQASVSMNDARNNAYKRIEASPRVQALEEYARRFETKPEVVAAGQYVHRNLPTQLQNTMWDPHGGVQQVPEQVIELDEPEPKDMGELDEPEGGYATSREKVEDKPSRYQAAVDKLRAAKKK